MYAAAWHRLTGATDCLVDLVDRYPNYPPGSRLRTNSNAKAVQALILLGESEKLIAAVAAQVLAILNIDEHVASSIEQVQIGGRNEMLLHQTLHELSGSEGQPRPYDPDQRRAKIEAEARSSHHRVLRGLLGPILRFESPALNELLSEVSRIAGLSLTPHTAAQLVEDLNPEPDQETDGWVLLRSMTMTDLRRLPGCTPLMAMFHLQIPSLNQQSSMKVKKSGKRTS